MYQLSDYHFDLPAELIAQKPTLPRDHCRLLAFNKKTKEINHKNFYNLLDYIPSNAVLVFNNSSVIPARLLGEKSQTGGKVELLLLRPIKDNIWEIMLKAKKKKLDMIIKFPKSALQVKLMERIDDMRWLVEFNYKGKALHNILQRLGLIPLPPYIKVDQDNKEVKKWLRQQYQTIYADKEQKGSVAAPTAGLHFTNRLLKKIDKAGIGRLNVTLHVGLGTFSPVRVDDISQHKMHKEMGIVSKETLKQLIKYKKEGRPIISVGTTSVRVLEGLVAKYLRYKEADFAKLPDYISKDIGIFIYPGYKFKVLDGLITNFHLPESTLLMLVAAFIGKENLDRIYKEAVVEKYRFFSFGDGMILI